jgi:hypothetical protein
MDRVEIINILRKSKMSDANDDKLVEKKPSIKLAQVNRLMPNEQGPVFKVMQMVDTLRYEIGERLNKAKVQELLDDGTVKVTIVQEK